MATAGTEIAVGDVAEPWTVGPVEIADFVRYAGAAGDFNRLHYDESYARSAGFPSVFAQGMFQAGVLAAYASSWLGPREVRRFFVRFVDVVWPGDTLTCTGEVVRTYVHENEQCVDIDLLCRRQTGDAVVRGSATFHVGNGSPRVKGG
jgi:acyl dehydratase